MKISKRTLLRMLSVSLCLLLCVALLSGCDQLLETFRHLTVEEDAVASDSLLTPATKPPASNTPATDPPATKPPATDPPAIQYTKSSTYLPSPDAFFNKDLARNEDFRSKDGNWVLSFKTDIDTGRVAFQEYISLLFGSRFQLELSDENERQILYLINYTYAFDYTGTGSVNPVTHESSGLRGDLVVNLQLDGQTETALLTMRYEPDAFTFVDDGDRCSYRLVDMSGKSQDDDDDEDDDDPAIHDCSFCDDGDCDTCDGYGYTYSYVSGERDKNCKDCGTSGDCRYCGGTGKRK